MNQQMLHCDQKDPISPTSPLNISVSAPSRLKALEFSNWNRAGNFSKLLCILDTRRICSRVDGFWNKRAVVWIGWKPKWVLPCCSLMSCDAGSSLAQRLMDGLVHVWTIKRAETWRTRTSNSSDISPPSSSLFFYYTKTTSTQGLNTRAKQSHCEITCSPWVDLGNYALVSQINEKLEMFSQTLQSRKFSLSSLNHKQTSGEAFKLCQFDLIWYLTLKFNTDLEMNKSKM